VEQAPLLSTTTSSVEECYCDDLFPPLPSDPDLEHVHSGPALRQVLGGDLPGDQQRPKNLVLLVSVPGCQDVEERLALLKSSLRGLVESLAPGDRVSLVVEARIGLRLPPTAASERTTILAAIDRLDGRSLDGSDATALAYRMARAGFIRGGMNHVLLFTDCGLIFAATRCPTPMARAIEEHARSGVVLTVVSFAGGHQPVVLAHYGD